MDAKDAGRDPRDKGRCRAKESRQKANQEEIVEQLEYSRAEQDPEHGQEDYRAKRRADEAKEQAACDDRWEISNPGQVAASVIPEEAPTLAVDQGDIAARTRRFCVD